jgi:hypothetical protein
MIRVAVPQHRKISDSILFKKIGAFYLKKLPIIRAVAQAGSKSERLSKT